MATTDKQMNDTDTAEGGGTTVSRSGTYCDKENGSTYHRRDAIAVTEKLDADASIFTNDVSPEANPSNQKQHNRKVLTALSMFNAKSMAAGNLHVESPALAQWKTAPTTESEGVSSNGRRSAVAVQRPKGKQLSEHLLSIKRSMVSPAPRHPMLLDPQGPLRASTRTPQGPNFLSPVAATPKDCGTTKFKSSGTVSSSSSSTRASPGRATPFVLGRLSVENAVASSSSASITRSSAKKKKAAPAMTLKIVTRVPMKFPEALDAMLAEATDRQSKALFWTHGGESFAVDNASHEGELAELLETYFSRK